MLVACYLLPVACYLLLVSSCEFAVRQAYRDGVDDWLAYLMDASITSRYQTNSRDRSSRIRVPISEWTGLSVMRVIGHINHTPRSRF